MNIKKIIKIVLVEAHTIFRYGIQKLFETEEDFSIIGETGDGRDGMKMALELRPDIVLMGINLPGLNGIESTRRITKANSSIHVIALSARSIQEYAINFLSAGGRGIVTQKCTFSELKFAIHSVVQGNRYLAVDVTGRVIDEALPPFLMHKRDDRGPLSHREREILQLISEGKTSVDTGKILGISKRTVDNHRKNIMDKLNIHNIAELTRYAILNGISFLS